MAVDRKGDHVGNHGGGYTDLDGMSKQFTYIDHDKKTKIATGKTEPSELEKIKEELKRYRLEVQDRISKIPASICPQMYHKFTLRGVELGSSPMAQSKIFWSDKALKDEGVSITELSTLLTHLENIAESKGVDLRK